jgi:Coenzyme PQQ synthesis protein D (PqqD)
MHSETSYRVNAPDVIHQVIDGEAVIINLARGFYYSLDRVGADVWDALAQGRSRAEVVSVIAGAYEGLGIDAAVTALVDELVAEELIVERAGHASAGGEDTRSERRGAFEAPILRKYTDLQDLLLLDPIHQVDEAGWPQTPGTPPGPGETARR